MLCDECLADRCDTCQGCEHDCYGRTYERWWPFRDDDEPDDIWQLGQDRYEASFKDGGAS